MLDENWRKYEENLQWRRRGHKTKFKILFRKCSQIQWSFVHRLRRNSLPLSTSDFPFCSTNPYQSMGALHRIRTEFELIRQSVKSFVGNSYRHFVYESIWSESDSTNWNHSRHIRTDVCSKQTDRRLNGNALDLIRIVYIRIRPFSMPSISCRQPIVWCLHTRNTNAHWARLGDYTLPILVSDVCLPQAISLNEIDILSHWHVVRPMD